ncbi:MAG: hypothetical protein EPN24_02455 [Candidatus Methanoperedens sp.]|nr:MAG: hypothetical protein EPN24_02455 [Candidatus Methanoperedens sp.]
MDKRKIGELLLILGVVLFVGGAVLYDRTVASRTNPWNWRSGSHLHRCRCGDEDEIIIRRKKS